MAVTRTPGRGDDFDEMEAINGTGEGIFFWGKKRTGGTSPCVASDVESEVILASSTHCRTAREYIERPLKQRKKRPEPTARSRVRTPSTRHTELDPYPGGPQGSVI